MNISNRVTKEQFGSESTFKSSELLGNFGGKSLNSTRCNKKINFHS